MSSSAIKLQALLSHIQSGRLRPAIEIANQILHHDQNNFDALHLRALALLYDNNTLGALRDIEKALLIRNDIADAYNTYGIILKALKRYDDAIVQFKNALYRRPNLKEALYNIGNCYQELTDFDAAIDFYQRALGIDGNLVTALNNLGVVLAKRKRHAAALTCFDNVIQKKPDFAEAYYNRGDALMALGSYGAAVSEYDKALKLKPRFPEAYCNRANSLRELSRYSEALDDYDKAIEQDMRSAEAYVGKAVVCKDLKLLEESVVCLDRAISLNPNFAEAYSNRGNALKDLKRLDEALESYDKAINLKPDYAEAYSNRGNALKDLKRLDEALESYDKAINLKPDCAEAYINRGNVFKELLRLDEALESYDKAINLKPDCAEAYINRGNALKDLKRLDEALASYSKAIKLKPDIDYLLGKRMHAKMKICDWSDFEANLSILRKALEAEQRVVDPWISLSLFDEPDLHRKAASIYASEKYAPIACEGNFQRSSTRKKIAIGYYSSDFGNHPVSFLTAELFEAHERDSFEVYAISFGPKRTGEMRHRIRTAFSDFIEVEQKSDREVIGLSRELRIDIAIDLNGFTEHQRTGLFQNRCAPIQVNYLGFPGTMGVTYMDYIVADRSVVPKSAEAYLAEKVVFLPDSFQVNDSKRKISDRLFRRFDLGLPEGGFVYACFHNPYKINPTVFASWMRILKRVPGSVLWLYEENRFAVNNLVGEAIKNGVDPSRLVIARKLNNDDYLARFRSADLFLDTIPYNAGTTASDALWAGLPVLTCRGNSFVSRMAASLLTSLDLKELIVDNLQDYEDLAVALASDRIKLSELRQKLARNRQTSSLFDGKAFARNIEFAYREMFERYQKGLPPDHIFVPRCQP